MMNIVKMKAPLLEAWSETKDIRVLKVGARMDFKPGQFVMVGFPGLPGKAMSICSSPTRPYLEFAARLSESEHKKKWASIQPGEQVDLAGPYGLFTLDETQKTAMLAGGIGITPFKCYMEYALDKGLDLDFALLYSNKTVEEIAYKKFFDEAARKSPKMKTVYTLTRSVQDGANNNSSASGAGNGSSSGGAWTGRTGRINRQMLEEEVPDFMERMFYICGVPEMVKDMAALLYDMGLDRKKVRREEFTGLK